MSASARGTEATVGSGMSKESARRCRAAGGLKLGEGNEREAQRLAAVILEVLAGSRTPAQAATALSVSVPRYYQLETRALRGLVEACERKPRGRVRSPDKELSALRRQQERLQARVDAPAEPGTFDAASCVGSGGAVATAEHGGSVAERGTTGP